LDGEKASLHERESALQGQIEVLRGDIDPAEKDLESAEVEEARLQYAEANAQRMLATAERLQGQVQLEQLRKQEALDNLRQKITDDFGLVMFEYEADVSGPVPLPFEGMVEELPVVIEITPDLEVQLARQRTQVRRMGPINPEAKQEFDKESERYSFMRAQIDDLRKAEEDLKHVIAELDELTRQEFSKTFDAVDKQFRVMFTRLFAGGSASAFLAQQGDGLGDLLFLRVAVAIYEEEILPRLPLARTRFDPGHVDAVAPERGEGAVQRADLVRDADHQAGAVVAGRRTALAAEDEEARGVGGVILDVQFQHAQVVFLGGEDTRNGGSVFLSRGKFSGAGIRRSFDDFDPGQIVLYPAAALGERLRMREQLFDFRARRVTQQTLLHAQDDL